MEEANNAQSGRIYDKYYQNSGRFPIYVADRHSFGAGNRDYTAFKLNLYQNEGLK